MTNRQSRYQHNEHRLDAISHQLDRIERVLHYSLGMEFVMSKEMDDLKAAVARNGDAEDSAITLIKGLAQQIRDSAGDPAAIAALATELNAKADALGAAITENTSA